MEFTSEQMKVVLGSYCFSGGQGHVPGMALYGLPDLGMMPGDSTQAEWFAIARGLAGQMVEAGLIMEVAGSPEWYDATEAGKALRGEAKLYQYSTEERAALDTQAAEHDASIQWVSEVGADGV